jgi:ABC-type dipeptide/oligopeptide/nickel transport system ATPase component
MGLLLLENKTTKSYYISYILNRISKNKNFIAAITGQTGSGKSYAALKLGEVLDPDFDIKNVCFTPEEFMDLVNGKTKQLKRGSIIIFDEIQVSMSNMEYHSMQARVLNYVFQTFRHRNFILFMTSPHFSFINASLRKLFHSRMETVRIDADKKICTLKPMLIQVNQKTGDIYEKYLRIFSQESGVIPIKSLTISLPSDKILLDYEGKKTKFTTDLNESITKDLEKIKNKGAQVKNKPLTTIQEQIVELLLQNMTISNVAKNMGRNDSYIYAQMELIKKKGVQFKPIKEGTKVLYYEITGNMGE